MNLPILKLDFTNNLESSFIDFWSEYYNYAKIEHFYDDTIQLSTFSADDIKMLFEWKNGMKLNGHVPKEASVNKVLSKLDIVNQLKSKFDITTFNSNFNGMSAIWKLFLLHIIRPCQYPIFDQHVYRAHFFIVNKEIKEIKESNKYKEEYYFKTYMPYYHSLTSLEPDLRKIDKALWSFGKFLKTHYATKLMSEPLEGQDTILPKKLNEEQHQYNS